MYKSVYDITNGNESYYMTTQKDNIYENRENTNNNNEVPKEKEKEKEEKPPLFPWVVSSHLFGWGILVILLCVGYVYWMNDISSVDSNDELNAILISSKKFK